MENNEIKKQYMELWRLGIRLEEEIKIIESLSGIISELSDTAKGIQESIKKIDELSSK